MFCEHPVITEFDHAVPGLKVILMGNNSVMLEHESYRPKMFYTNTDAEMGTVGSDGALVCAGCERAFPQPANFSYRPKSEVLFTRSSK